MPLKKQTKPELVELITASQYKDSQVTRHYGGITMAYAMNAQTPTIWRWTKDQGEDKMIPAIAKLFIGASLYFDAPISQDQAEGVVTKLLADYELSNLKLEDLVVCCKELTESTQYGKLTPNKILSHIKEYRERRTKVAIQTSINDSLTHKNNDTMDIAERMKNTIALPDAQGARVDRTRASVKKYYK